MSDGLNLDELRAWLETLPALALKALADRPEAHAAPKSKVIGMILSDEVAIERALDSHAIMQQAPARAEVGFVNRSGDAL